MCQYHVFTHETVSNEDFAVSGIPAPDPSDTERVLDYESSRALWVWTADGMFPAQTNLLIELINLINERRITFLTTRGDSGVLRETDKIWGEYDAKKQC